jgi:hypothetical protein
MGSGFSRIIGVEKVACDFLEIELKFAASDDGF